MELIMLCFYIEYIALQWLYTYIYIMKMIPFGVQYVLCIFSGNSGDLNFLTDDDIF